METKEIKERLSEIVNLTRSLAEILKISEIDFPKNMNDWIKLFQPERISSLDDDDFIKWIEAFSELNKILTNLRGKINNEYVVISDTTLRKEIKQILDIGLPDIEDVIEDWVGNENDRLIAFTALYHPDDYFRRRYDVRPLIIGEQLPDLLKSFLNDLKESYSLGLANPICALCRTVIDSAMFYCAVERKPIIATLDEYSIYKDYPPKKMSELVTVNNKPLRKKMRSLHHRFSSIIHGRKTSDFNLKESITETFKVVEELFDHNFHSSM